MKNFSYFLGKNKYWLLFLFGVVQLGAQPEQYFQQETNYKITVTLDDKANRLDGEVLLEYYNFSPHIMNEIYFHLWPNAYLDRESAFAKQQVTDGGSRFYFADEEDLGGFDKISFWEGDRELRWAFHPDNKDMAEVALTKPLYPGNKVVLRIPFTLGIPSSFSRLGHVGQSYQMTQWYPKPAVFDRNGWNAFPYLDRGEFYSEFGDFEVSITLPENYVVGATGELQEESEKLFLAQKVLDTEKYLSTAELEPLPILEAIIRDTFPASSEKMKTVTFKAEKVHDFAWFADKRFRVLHGEINMPSGRKVDSWAYFNFVEEWLWKDALLYLERSTLAYSEWVGEYPWPHVSAVLSPRSAGGGMEYPMITLIGRSGSARNLDEVITHEVGHNWFYGILGSNEREHPWMDEGINSYYEYRYMDQYYGPPETERLLPNIIAKSTDLNLYELAYLYFERSGRDMPPATHSNSSFDGAYWMGSYIKPALALKHLENYLGQQRFDLVMRSYYDQWKFRHPQPEDFQTALQQGTGEDLDWFFEGFLYSTDHMNYHIQKVEVDDKIARVLVENKGELTAPFPITGFQDSMAVRTEWVDGFEGQQWVTFPRTSYSHFEIDAGKVTVEADRGDNSQETTGFFSDMRPLKLYFASGLENTRERHLYYSPLISWNDYDKWMPGLALHNMSIVERPFEFALVPFYSFVTNKLNGVASAHFNTYFRDGSSFRRFRLGASAKSYTSNYNWRDAFYTGYNKFRVFADLDLYQPNGIKGARYFSLQGINTNVERPVYDPETGNFVELIQDNGIFIDLGFHEENNRGVNPYSLETHLEYKAPSNHAFGSEPYLKAWLAGEYSFTYQRFKNLKFRLFAGGFIMNENRGSGFIFPWSLDLTSQGAGDYLYDGFYFGRSDQGGAWYRQVSLEEGGFRSALPPPFRSVGGASNSMLVSLNLTADFPRPMPIDFPLKVFVNAAFSEDKRPFSTGATFSDQLWWEAGLTFEAFNGLIAFSMPLVVSDNLDSLFDQNGQSNWYSRFSFTLDFHRFDPVRFRENTSF